MEKKSPFAVVAFIEEETDGDQVFSEIPVSWLVGEDQCYWPSSKNVNRLISKSVQPDPKWKKFKIEVRCYCDSLSSARKKAESSYTSNEDEAPKGKGMRKKKKTLKTIEENNLTSDEEEIEQLDLTSIPEFPRNQEHSQLEKCEDSSSDNFDLNSVPIIIENGSHQVLTQAPELGEIKTLISEKFSAVMTVLTNINMNISDINRRLDKIDRNANKTHVKQEDIEELLNMLPLGSIEDVSSFEELISIPHNKSNLINYLINIGGSNTKECIVRTLKKIFSNSMAVKSSWLGQRNNFRVCDLKTIGVIKVAVRENFPHSEKEFENVASEWFRQGKQRLTRETKNAP